MMDQIFSAQMPVICKIIFKIQGQFFHHPGLVKPGENGLGGLFRFVLRRLTEGNIDQVKGEGLENGFP